MYKRDMWTLTLCLMTAIGMTIENIMQMFHQSNSETSAPKITLNTTTRSNISHIHTTWKINIPTPKFQSVSQYDQPL